MNFPIRFLPEARQEFDAAVATYEKARRGLGRDFLTRVREVLRRISLNPRLHAVVYQDVRKALVARFRYVVLYREDPSGVIVISIFHTSRDPGIWQARV